MKKVQLPYNEPPYSTYHYLSTAGIVTSGVEGIQNWYYNNTLQWRCSDRFLYGYSSPELAVEAGSIWEMPFVEKFGLSVRYAKNSFSSIAKSMLDDGRYVYYSGIDDYYIKGKTWYKSRHFPHDGLLIGYDDADGSLTTAAYDSNWVFRPFKISASDFDRAARSDKVKQQGGGIWALAIKSDPHKLDLAHIQRRLDEYLAGERSGNNETGVKVYVMIDIYLRLLSEGMIDHEKMDWRLFRLIYEHKKCMLGRIKAVERAIRSDGSLSDAYYPIVEKAERLKFIYAKYRIKRNDELIGELRKGLADIKEKETELLVKLNKMIARQLKDEAKI